MMKDGKTLAQMIMMAMSMPSLTPWLTAFGKDSKKWSTAAWSSQHST